MMPVMTFGLNNLKRIYPIVLITGAVTPMFLYKQELVKALVDPPSGTALAWQLFLAAGAIGLTAAIAVWLMTNGAGGLKFVDHLVGKLFPPDHPKWVLLIVLCGTLGVVALYVAAVSLNTGKLSVPPWAVSYLSVWLMVFKAVDSEEESVASARQEDSASVSISG